MKTPTHQYFLSFSLSLLLLLPAIPADAGETAAGQGELDLHLQEALALQGASLPFDVTKDVAETALAQSEQQIKLMAPDLAQTNHPSSQWMASEETSRIAFETQVVRQVNSHGGEFRKWIKKYWYVPVIAGAVIGVALSDDGSDSNDPED